MSPIVVWPSGCSHMPSPAVQGATSSCSLVGPSSRDAVPSACRKGAHQLRVTSHRQEQAVSLSLSACQCAVQTWVCCVFEPHGCCQPGAPAIPQEPTQPHPPTQPRTQLGRPPSHPPESSMRPAQKPRAFGPPMTSIDTSPATAHTHSWQYAAGILRARATQLRFMLCRVENQRHKQQLTHRDTLVHACLVLGKLGLPAPPPLTAHQRG